MWGGDGEGDSMWQAARSKALKCTCGRVSKALWPKSSVCARVGMHKAEEASKARSSTALHAILRAGTLS